MFIVIILIVIVGAAGIITSYVKKYTPSDTRMDLEQYYKLEGQEEAALILQDTVSDSKGRVADGKIYIPYSVVTDTLDGRFYWDEETQKMLYTTPDAVMEIQPELRSVQPPGQSRRKVSVLVEGI